MYGEENPAPGEALATLTRATIFESIPEDGLRWLVSRARWRTFPPGATLQEREPAESVHVLQQGRVQVQRTHPDLLEPVVLDELWPGDVVGQMWVPGSELRPALVVALEHTVTLELERAALEELVQGHPELSTVLAPVLSR